MSISDGERLQQAYAQPKATRIWTALQALKSVASFMNTGAHPDDETSKMIAAIGLRDGVKLSHACSTRGEGGQNAIGTETQVKLGIVRTREMERAADILNMTQYWLCQTPDDPLADFGFSKSGEETLAIWGEERTLERFVQILRQERPDMIAVTFLDVPGQHGHHRAMTQSAFKAVKLAADETYKPELGLDVWQVKKLYLPAWSGAGDAYDDDLPPPPKTVVINGTGSDPVFGMDYAQIGEVSRSYHMTQGMGTWHEAGGEWHWPLNLAWNASENPTQENSIYDNLPYRLADLAEYANAPALAEVLHTAQSNIDAAIDAWPNNQKVSKFAAQALNAVREALKACPEDAKPEIAHRLDAKIEQLSRVLYLAGDVQPRFALSKYEARAGEKITGTVHLPNGAELDDLDVVAPAGWTVSRQSNLEFEITLSEDAAPSDPLPDEWHPMRANSELHVVATFRQGAEKYTIEISPEERLNVVSSRVVSLSKTAAIINLNAPKPLDIFVEKRVPETANLSIDTDMPFNLDVTNTQITVEKNDASKAGLYSADLLLDDQPAHYEHRMSYPHTGTMTYAETAKFKVLGLELDLPKGKIGYVAGGSDRAAYWLRQAGFELTDIGDDVLERGNFDEFDSILIGVFALRTRPALHAQLSKIHKWVHAGGNLVTLYHRPWDNWDSEKSALAPMTIGKPSLRWRVTNPNAEVTTLVPEHELLQQPNQITAADWSGWDKERGLYFASKWSDEYKPLFSMADEGEDQLQGALLTGQFGEGRHTHTSLILHHQLDQLVPGAYRIMANLLNACR